MSQSEAEIKRVTTIVRAEDGEVLHRSEDDMMFQLFTKSGYVLHNKEAFVKLFHGHDWTEITGDEWQKLNRLRVCLDNHNRLIRPDRPGHAMMAKHISQTIEVSEPRTYSFMKAMKDKNVLRKDEGFWYVNPLFMLAGTRIPVELFRVFQAELEPYLPDWAIERYKELMTE